VQRATEPLGYEPERRDFTAHVTIARSQRARPLANLVHSLGDGPVGPVFDVDEVLLMESDTRWDGAVYREIASFPLVSR
jgi:2'-5' RNA ligase